jgi:hypothetical protein
MFAPIPVPCGAKMLFTALKLKPGARAADLELTTGDTCNV